MEGNRGSKRGVSKKINPTTETVDTQYQLETDRLSKKRELRTKQYNEYRILFYGTPQEKEDVKQKHRQALLDQVKGKEVGLKDQYNAKVSSGSTIPKEVKNKITNVNKSKEEYLKQFRDQNKQLMERRANEQRTKREEENRKEQELLKNDPINWSKTLV